MKTIQKLLFLVLISQSIPFLLSAQRGPSTKSLNPEKPMIFSGLPERFECNTAVLRQLFTTSLNDEISFELTRNVNFRGKIAARVQRDANVLSINILSSNFPGTLLNISLITNADKTERIIGRFINPRNGDVLMIDQENNRLFITKDLQKFVMTECPLPDMVEGSRGL
ncbi:MAG: hypothetical protein EOO04_09985 [Chitinophagaceae bacterium]|nr:MAG: hypothetical protein EOO04_09985 [Chitinophagaceae bacterium]